MANDPKLLVVDDNEDNRYMLIGRLRREGFHAVVQATNGREALERLRGEPFDLVFLDIMMPEVNGYEVLARMKDDPALRDIPVIVISALDELESALRCIENGADEYLGKPFNPALLRARLRACLDRKKRHDLEVSLLAQVQQERSRADALLEAIFPLAVMNELKTTGAVAPRRHEDVAVLFCDIVGFTSYCDCHGPERVVSSLQALVTKFEDLTARHGLEKIKTVGDAFMATGGLLGDAAEAPLNSIRCGLAMVEAAARTEPFWRVRVGIHGGPVVAGVMGRRQYLFDVWGDTVNTAARITSVAAPNSVFVSETLWRRAGARCVGRPLGPVEIRGKGMLDLFHCTGTS
jgi:adenylate cyclase